MELSERVREAVKGSGKPQAALAREMGVSQSAIAQWMSGNVKSLRAESASALEAATGYSARWIVTGKGPQHIANVESLYFGTAAPVPLISWVQAGEWSAIVDNFQPGDAEEWLQCPIKHSVGTFALRVRGVSMYNPGGEPSFKDGDTIFVDPQRDAHHRSLVVVRLDDEEETTFKQLLVEGNDRFLQALNPNWPEKIIAFKGKASLCGVVIAQLNAFV